MIFNRVISVFSTKTWGCNEGEYSFLIAFDQQLNVYTASWHTQTGHSSSEFLGERIHPTTNLPYFTSRGAAMRACEDAYKQLSNKN